MDKARDLKFGSFLMPPQASMEQIVETVTAGGPSTCGTEVVVRVGVRENTVLLRDTNPETGAYEEMARWTPGSGDRPAPLVQAQDRADVRLSLVMAEGVTSWQVVEALRAADFLTGEVAEIPAEGSLAPDTYLLEKGGDRNAILAQMASRQAAILAQEWEARPFGMPYETPEEALIMASIVEKETGQADERPQVASVFVNRLRQGMRLQTDPTVIYGVTNGQAVLDRGLRRSELDTPTPLQHVPDRRAAAHAHRQSGPGCDPRGAEPRRDGLSVLCRGRHRRARLQPHAGGAQRRRRPLARDRTAAGPARGQPGPDRGLIAQV